MNSRTAFIRLSVCIVLVQSAAVLSCGHEPSAACRQSVEGATSPASTQRSRGEDLRDHGLRSACAGSDEQTTPIRNLQPISSRRPLFVLDLQGCPVDDTSCQSIAEVSELQELQLICTQITNAGLKPLRRLKNLQWLDLRGTRVTDEGMASLSALSSLTMLDVRGTAVTDSGVEHLRSLRPHLVILSDRKKRPAGADKMLAAVRR